MTAEFIQGLMIPLITAFCFAVGYIMKKWLPTDDKYIPTVVFIIGALTGFFFFGQSFEAVVKGAISGIASTGLHQLYKQYLKLPMGDDEIYAMGKGEEDEDESE